MSAGLCQAADLNITTFGGRADDGSDTTPAARKALAECRRHSSHKLVFPKGRYDFWPEKAEEAYYFISNNDEGLKRVAFLLRAMQNLEIDGQGSIFVFHGFLNPFIIDGSKNITLKNVTLDFARTFHSEATILGERPEGLEVEFVRASGKTQAVVTLAASDVRPVLDNDLVAVRSVEQETGAASG